MRVREASSAAAGRGGAAAVCGMQVNIGARAVSMAVGSECVNAAVRCGACVVRVRCGAQ